MPEPPDFEQLARGIADRADRYRAAGETRGVVDDALRGAIILALRQVWNARGAADIAQTEAYLWGRVAESGHVNMPAKPAVIGELERALRTLDR